MQKFEHIQKRIFSQQELKLQLAVWNFQQKSIVFTNGCFDVLHMGHVEYLAKAASLGDILIVGLNTDASVKRLKGPERPVNNQQARATLMAALRFVDAVVYFEEDTPFELIKLVQPDILVKGSDYKPEDIVGYDVVMAKGGRVETISLVEGYSSSSVIEKMKKA